MTSTTLLFALLLSAGPAEEGPAIAQGSACHEPLPSADPWLSRSRAEEQKQREQAGSRGACLGGAGGLAFTTLNLVGACLTADVWTPVVLNVAQSAFGGDGGDGDSGIGLCLFAYGLPALLCLVGTATTSGAAIGWIVGEAIAEEPEPCGAVRY